MNGRPPSRDEVLAYLLDKGYINPSVEARRFYDYYTSNGWRVGRNPMKNWHSAVANWVSQGYGAGAQSTPIRKTKRADSPPPQVAANPVAIRYRQEAIAEGLTSPSDITKYVLRKLEIDRQHELDVEEQRT